MPLTPGARLGLYEIIVPLGAGGMARCTTPTARVVFDGRANIRGHLDRFGVAVSTIPAAIISGLASPPAGITALRSAPPPAT